MARNKVQQRAVLNLRGLCVSHILFVMTTIVVGLCVLLGKR
jgi:hypothetical protein